MFNFHRWRVKRLSGHHFVGKDLNGMEYYISLTGTLDISLLAFHPKNKTYREFMLDYAFIRSMIKAIDVKPLTPHKGLVDLSLTHPSMVDDYVKGGFTIVRKVGDRRLFNAVSLAKVIEFDEGKHSLAMRRVVYTPDLVIGIDTLVLPLMVARPVLDYLNKVFKDDVRKLEAKVEEELNGN